MNRLARFAEACAVLLALYALYVAAHFLLRSPTPLGGTEHRTKDYPMNGINSAAVSKINWVNGLAFVVAVASVFGFVIPDEYQKTFLEITATATPLVTVVLRSFFTAK